MATHHDTEKRLRSHVLDDVEYTPAQVRAALAGLVIGLWGPFIASLIVLYLCTRGVIESLPV